MSFEQAEAQWEERMYTNYWDTPNREAFDQDNDDTYNAEKMMKVYITKSDTVNSELVKIEMSTRKAFSANAPVFIFAYWEKSEEGVSTFVIKGETARDDFLITTIPGPLDEQHVVREVARLIEMLGVEVEGVGYGD